MGRRKCAVCASRQWHKELSSGLITCSEGHVLQDYRNEVRDVEEFGQHAMRKRTLKSERKKKFLSKADPNLYHGDRARYHFFQCQQLILRIQVQNVLDLWQLPIQFETVCRDIWALQLTLLPNPPPPEPYFFLQDISGMPSRPVAFANSDQYKPPLDLTAQGYSDAGSTSSESSSSSSSVGVPEEDVDGMADLRREASASSSSSEDEDEGNKPQIASEEINPIRVPRRNRRKAHSSYDGPINNIAVLMLGCWTLRIPVTYMDFVRAIESYDLVYLDPVRLLPATLVRHLTQHTIQALSPHFAPRPLQMHGLVSRLAKLLWRKYDVFTPEMNVAPLLWRAVRAFDGTPTLYTLTKKIAKILNLPLTLHYSLSTPLARKKARDSSWHKFDNIPVEVSMVCAVIIVMKLAYGLDGVPRLPKSREDPMYTIPDLQALLNHIKIMEEAEKRSMHGVLTDSSELTALDIRGDQLDEYLDFCEKALLPRNDRRDDHITLKEYFPLQSASRSTRDILTDPTTHTALPAIAIRLNPSDDILCPGQSYKVYSSTDILGTFPEEYDIIVHRAASWTGVDEEFIHGVVENLERRLWRWWENIERQKHSKVKPKTSSNSMNSRASDQ